VDAHRSRRFRTILRVGLSRGLHDVFAKKKPRGTKDTKDPNDCDCTFCSHLGENLTSLLLAHARLYVFANLYRIESLNKLVASKIQKILSNPNPCTCHIQGVLALARYVYSDDAYMPDRDECDRLDYLRSVVMTSVVELTRMGHYVLFLPFLEEGGQRAADFCLLAMAPDVHGTM
jgi:hypothetical protein